MPVSTFRCTGCRCHSKRRSCFVQRFDLPRLPHCRSEAQPHNFAFFAAPEARHQQNVCPNAGLAQRNRFIERCHSQPVRAFRFEVHASTRQPVTVSVGLDHGANGYAFTHVLLDGAEILPQCSQRYVRPRRARRHSAQDFCSSRHFRDYSGSRAGPPTLRRGYSCPSSAGVPPAVASASRARRAGHSD